MRDDAMRRLAVRLMVVAAAMIPLWAVTAIIGGVVVDLPVFVIIGALLLPVGIGFVVVACRRVREVGSGVQSAAMTPPDQGPNQIEAPGREPAGYNLPPYGAPPPAGSGAGPHAPPDRPAKGTVAHDPATARNLDRLQMVGGTMVAVAALMAISAGVIRADPIYLIGGVAFLVGATLIIVFAQVQLRARRSGAEPIAAADPRWTSTGAVEPPTAHQPMPATPATPIDGPDPWQQPPGPQMQR